MILWPKQLQAINELVALKEISTVGIISLPLVLEVTVTYDDGTWSIHNIDMDGNEIPSS